MAAIPIQQIPPTGLAPTFASAAAGDTVVPSDRTILRVNNGGGSSITVTLTASRACSQGSLHDRVVTVAAGAIEDIPTGPASQFLSDTTGTCAVTYSSTASVTRAAIGT